MKSRPVIQNAVPPLLENTTVCVGAQVEAAAQGTQLPAQPRVQPSKPWPMLMSIKRAMEELSVGRTTIFAMLATGELERIPIRGRSLVSSSSVRRVAEGDNGER